MCMYMCTYICIYEDVNNRRTSVRDEDIFSTILQILFVNLTLF